MTEHKLFEGAAPFVATAEFHRDRARAPHLEQDAHRPRLVRAAQLIREIDPRGVVDLGCGDGGLLSLLAQAPPIPAWGYDFQPSNQDGWAERGVTAELHDVFGTWTVPRWAELAVLTEVLEHLADPHAALAWVARHVGYVVASSPWGEGPGAHPEEHAWAWDVPGYAALFAGADLTVIRHERLGWSQIVVGMAR